MPNSSVVDVYSIRQDARRKLIGRAAESWHSAGDRPYDREQGIKMPAKGRAEWQGDLKSGKGTFTAGDTISGQFSFRSRFEDGPGANPEQLIAAAHASCFSMALSNALAEAGTPPTSVTTDAVVTLRLLDGIPTITKIELSTVGVVPGLDEAGFQAQAAEAKKGCIISRALAAVPEITLEATLGS
jgi:osmotically inducible protein OsmC